MLHAYCIHADYFNVNYHTLCAFNRYCIMYYCTADPITRVNYVSDNMWDIPLPPPFETRSFFYNWWGTNCNKNGDTVELQCIVDTGQYKINVLENN